ncbi:MAG: efflux transporter outer membrane subunit [Desulfovibrionaceae bacterium]|nr:efflux transporter outer membrane subunit [Desulfovibrionaceae bacterium]
MKKYINILLVTMVVSACSLAPKYEQPKMDLPDSWEHLDTTGQKYDGRLWWQRFNDATLNTLVEEGLQNNQNLLVAVARLEQMRASWGVERAGMFPTLSTTVGASIGQQSKQIYGSNKVTDQYQISVGLNYEIDFWGKMYNLSEVAKAQYLTAEANREIVRLELISNIITSYFNIITLERQFDFINETLTAIQKQLTIRQQELQYGVITLSDLKQMEAQVASLETTKAQLDSALIEARSSLLLLLGRSPREMLTKKLSFPDATIDFTRDYEVSPGLPSNILLRRPDIYQAEQAIRGANANIGVARSLYFPSISLNAVVGVLSKDINRVFAPDTFTWNAGVTSNAPLFAGGKIIYQNRIAKAAQKEAIAQYQLAVQNAYKDVISSLSQLQQTKIALESALTENNAYKETFMLTEQQFNAGQVNYFQYLSILQSYIASQERLLIAQKNRVLAVVASYKSLGGDWEDPKYKKTDKDDTPSSMFNNATQDIKEGIKDTKE